MQPTHATSDMPWAEARVGPERIKGAYAWRRLLNVGCRIPLGSDFPVESVNPLWGIYAAVTRQDHDGHPTGGWHAEERMTIEEAVRGFTQSAAYASFMDSALGVIREGAKADLTVLDRDVFRIAPSEILMTRVLYTILSGRLVYEADSLSLQDTSPQH
jgi:predicted amidohydrolase YtcJ